MRFRKALADRSLPSRQQQHPLSIILEIDYDFSGILTVSAYTELQNDDNVGVLIVGAGPVGLFTALKLCRENLPVTVIEKVDSILK
jgi:ribulose 1,5-bisphosphate synthetase/thiazole synthase